MIYNQSFAEFYATGPYTDYSRRMAELLPSILGMFDFRPSAILDIACGEGTFAIALAKNGDKVTGVDLSPPMLQIADVKARAEQVDVTFINQDMRSMLFENDFDLVTCWYDSLNYLLTTDDLLKTFRGVYRALKDTGLFIFDMNSIYALSVIWQQNPCEIEQDTPTMLEIHRKTYNNESNNAQLHITCFLKDGEHWSRTEEIHTVHGFSLREIRDCLEASGLREVACWGSIRNLTEPAPDSGKVWFVCQK